MDTIITRVGFCPKCYKAERPRTDNFFVVMGNSGWHIMKAAHIGNIGFTPHIYKVVKVDQDRKNVIYQKICSMHDCGTEVYWSTSQNAYQFHIDKGEREIMTIENWNALVMYKRDLDYEI